MSEIDLMEIDKIIANLLSVSEKNPGTIVHLDLEQIQSIIEKSKEIILSQPMMLRLKAPLTVGTDIHG